MRHILYSNKQALTTEYDRIPHFADHAQGGDQLVFAVNLKAIPRLGSPFLRRREYDTCRMRKRRTAMSSCAS